ncbi:hypothetical protein Q3V94_02675 [Caloramator sp. CAR-1]|uniref:hypothetical protein n=1 Tax=Caloramator sp. CAR-1 TaxID=3062777 RepID=UPI0026E33A52|nr:hypothetical protein [Caloramator sp. CAR-1]MDO6353548.1 hypothetical protein [Caloramator sp. CAR-1]MDO6353989.1 hypothetical protein [Caloramator sp. CAR-1]
MELLILKKDDTYVSILNKAKEEVDELWEELFKYEIDNIDNKEEIAAETLDVIQVCIGLLDKLETEGMNIRKAVEKHNLKLLNRGWKYKKVIHIDIE